LLGQSQPRGLSSNPIGGKNWSSGVKIACLLEEKKAGQAGVVPRSWV